MAPLTAGGDNASTTFSGALSGTGGAFTKGGTGVMTLSGNLANSNTGLTTVSSGELDLNKTAGTDAIGSGGVTIATGTLRSLAANQINDGATVTVTTGATWNMDSHDETVAALAGGGNVTEGTGNLTVGNTVGTSATFAGTISSIGGGVTKVGSNTQTLSGANTYTGGTTISTGTLTVTNTSNSATGNASVAVNNGGILMGSSTASQGIVTGAVTVAGGGSIASAGAINGLTLSGGLNLQAGSASNFTLLAPTGNGTPLINVSAGNLTVGSYNTINLTAGAGFGAGTYDLFHYTGSDPYANFTLGSQLNGFSCVLQNNTNEIDLVVTAISTTVTCASNPSVFGQSVTFTATVTVGAGAGTPTGTITFQDGSSSIGTCSLNGSAVATFSTSTLTVATHTINAVYGGDSCFTSCSGSMLQTVNQDSTTTTITASSPNPSTPAQNVTFTATVTVTYPGVNVPTGTVTFSDGSMSIGTAGFSGNTTTSATATFTTTELVALGSHTITAQYSGDTNDNPGSPSVFNQTVLQTTTTTISSNSTNPSVFGESLSFTATVSGGFAIPAGTVTFEDGSTSLGTQALDGSGTATFTTSSLTVATHTIKAIYHGDGNSFGSTSDNSIAQTVTRDSTATTITASSPNTPTVGQTVSFTATVTAEPNGSGTPTGTVTFMYGSTSLGTAALSGGSVTFTTSTSLPAGNDAVTAVYGAGDANFTSSSSATFTQSVSMDSTATTVASSAISSVYGQSVTFTATVTANAGGVVAPTGTVTFQDGTTSIGTASLSSSGQATYSAPSSVIDSVATHTITASYSGDTNFSGSSDSVTQTVNKDNTTTTITASYPNPSNTTQNVTFTATVTVTSPVLNVPTGTVTFSDGSTSIGTAGFSGNTTTSATATFTTTTTFDIGIYQITAQYSGDTNDDPGSPSPVFNQTALQTTTTTVSSNSTNPSVFGESLSFTATVSGYDLVTPTGTVTFEDGSISIGAIELSDGTATFTTSSLPAATHTITAVYHGDSNSFGSPSENSIAQTVGQASTTTSVTSSTSASVFGASVTFTATVTATGFDNGGTVTFEDGSTSIGTASVSSGTATFSTAGLAAVTHTINAVYGGDTNFSGSTDSVHQTVNQASTCTSVTSSTDLSVFGQSVTFTATVTSSASGMTGMVTFSDGSTSIGTGSVSGGAATLTAPSSVIDSVTTHTITASYAGDTNFSDSTTTSDFLQTVNQASTSTTVSSSPNPSLLGNTVTFTATVSAVAPGAGTATGTVTFEDGGSSIGTSELSGNTATYTTSGWTNKGDRGAHSITAVYGSDTNFSSSTSNTVTQTVQQSTTATVTSSTDLPVFFGQPVTFTATVTATGGFDNGGTVTFEDGSTSIGTASFSGGDTATFSTAGLSAATHTINAVYGGDVDFAASTGSVVQTVNKASTNIPTVDISPSYPSIFGQLVTFTSSVTASPPGGGTPTGTVTFYVDYPHYVVLGTGTLDSQGVATFTTSSWAATYHQHNYAVYGGDSNFNDNSGNWIYGVYYAVNQASSTTSLAASTNASVFGQVVTFSATVTLTTTNLPLATGTVTFKDGTTSIGTGSLNASDVATFTTSNLTLTTTHTITAAYSGDTNVYTSTSGSVLQTVNKASTTTDLSPSSDNPNPLYFGQTVTYTVTVSASDPGVGTPTGTVTFEDGTSSIGTGTLTTSGSDGVYTFTSSTLAYGTHTLSAVYAGDNNFTGSPSNTIPPQTVNQAVTTTTLSRPLNSSVVGQTITFTATVTVTNPSGGVLPNGGTVTFTFSDGSSSIGTASLSSSGVATFTTIPLAQGDYNITAVYGGDTNYRYSWDGPLTQVVNPPSFQVTFFTQTATGFIADFNGLLNAGTTSAPILNLYDDAGGSLGPTDVTLIGNTGTGNITIRGSLVVTTVGGNNSQIQFIETGESGVQGSAAPSTLFGVLPNGTYTVTLRSATNGFQDNTTAGVLLGGIASFTGTTHGNTTVDGIVTTGLFPGKKVFGDGIPDNDTIAAVDTTTGSITLSIPATGNATVSLKVGSDYVTTFVVANPSSSVTVTLPDFARGAGQLVNVPNTDPADTTFSTGLPLRLYNSSSSDSQTITSVSLTLKYDSSLLSVDASQYYIDVNDPSGPAVTTFDASTPGLINITFTASTGIVLAPGDSQTFISLHMAVPSTAYYAAKEILDLQNIDINNGIFTSGNGTAIDDAAVHVSGFLGDANGDETDNGDALYIARVAVGSGTGFKAWVLVDPLIVGDASGDQQLTGLDALTMARQSVGITQSVIPETPVMHPQQTLGPDPMMSISADLTANPQATVKVPVNLTHPNGLDAVELAISYDPSRLDVISTADVMRGSLTETFDNFTVNLDRAAGIIRISGYRSAGPLSGLAEGSVAVISFHVRANAPAGPAIINLMQNVGTTWSLPGGTDAQGNDFLFDLQPQVSNAAGDPLDGRINVLPAPAATTEVLSAGEGPVFSCSALSTQHSALTTSEQAGMPSADAGPLLIVSAPVSESYMPADAVNQAATLRSLVAILVAEVSATSATAAPASLAAGIASAGDNGLDDFFSRYPALAADGGVGSGERGLMEKELAALTADEREALFFEEGEMKVPGWLEDVELP